MKTLSIALTLALMTTAALAQGPLGNEITIWNGNASTDCDNLIRAERMEPGVAKEVFATWVYGFLAGSLADGANRPIPTDFGVDAQWDFAFAYCHRNPSRRLIDAALALRDEVTRRQSVASEHPPSRPLRPNP